MATHRIWAPDYRRGGAPRMIDWDDETGEVSGDHAWVPRVRDYLKRAARDGYLLGEEGRVALPDPLHSAGDFLAVLIWAVGGRRELLDLPSTLRAVEPAPLVQPRLPAGTVS